MSSSSDEEIIRRLNKRTKDLKDLFTESESDVEYESDDAANNIYVPVVTNMELVDIFGNGGEYNFVLDGKMEGEVINEDAKKSAMIIEGGNKRYIEFELFRRVVECNIGLNISDSTWLDLYQMLKDGKAIEYIAFCSGIGVTIYELYDIIDLIELVEKMWGVNTFKGDVENIQEYCMRIDDYNTDIIKNYSVRVGNPYFVKVILDHSMKTGYYNGIMISEYELNNLHEILVESNKFDLEVDKLGINRNEFLHLITEETFQRTWISGIPTVSMDKFVEDFNFDLILEKFHSLLKKKCDRSLFNTLLDRIVNGRVYTNINAIQEYRESSGAINAKRYCIWGVFLHKQKLMFICMDFNMNIISRNEINLNDFNGISNYLKENRINVVYTTGKGNETGRLIRMFRTRFSDIKLLFVENKLVISDEDALRSVICPELVIFNRLEEGAEFFILAGGKYIKYSNDLVVRRSITTSLGIVGCTRIELVPLLGFVDEFDSIREYGTIGNLTLLRDKNFIRDFDSFCTFFRIYNDSGLDHRLTTTYDSLYKKRPDYSSFNVLDSLPIHPNDYDKVVNICTSALGSDELNEDDPSNIVLKAVENESLLVGMKDANKDYEFFIDILLGNNVSQRKLSDDAVFENLFDSNLIGKTIEGRVAFVKGRCVIVEGEDISVRCECSSAVSINRIVRVKILGKDVRRLSFDGEIIVEETYHPPVDAAFSNFSLPSNDLYSFTRTKTGFAIRIKITGEITSTILVTNLTIDGIKYDTIDEIESVFVRRYLSHIRDIKRSKIYKNSEELVDEAGIFFSKEYPGWVVFLVKKNGKESREYIKIGKFLYHKELRFDNIERFIMYRIQI